MAYIKTDQWGWRGLGELKKFEKCGISGLDQWDVRN